MTTLTRVFWLYVCTCVLETEQACMHDATRARSRLCGLLGGLRLSTLVGTLMTSSNNVGRTFG